MTAFSTGVICQPLLALQPTKEAEVEQEKQEWGATESFGGRGMNWVFSIIISGAA